MRKIKFILAAVFLSTSIFAQKPNKNTKPYPFGNPVVSHMYTADASPHVLPDGRLWMVTSVDSDEGGGYPTMHSYHSFSTDEMGKWKDHGEIFNIADIMPKDAKNEDWALWAPDIIYRNGKYYLYFPAWIARTDSVNSNGGRVVRSYIGVAESDAPDKHFKVLKSRIDGTNGIDPAVFADDDGKVYLLFGNKKMARLKENMMELDGKVTTLDLDTDKFMEALWMHKKDNKYFVYYHTKYQNKIDKDNPDDPARLKSEIAWSVADKPFGPYRYGGILNYELGVNVNDGPKMPGKNYVPWRLTQSNHVGVTEFHGKDYLFYHTSALSSWRQDEFKNMGTWTQRSVCIDEIRYDKNGFPLPVQQTLEGVPAVKINQPYEIVLARSAKVGSMPQVLVYKDVNLGSGYYYFGLDVKNAKKPFSAEVRIGNPEGLLLGTIMANGNGKAETFLRNARGKQNIYIVFKDIEAGNLELSSLRFFAGSAMK